ncbi:MAG: glycosyltransferase [Proteobacteria bacterium]|nr:glycosyltransferase [Pseudomonadota bacterium]MDA1323447.1 glycosyltransferase [Pseudomonadota bacterium]
MTAPFQPRALFYVQHLLGIGHLKRAATLSRAMEEAGFAVTIVSGGKAVPGLDIGTADFVQLAPMRSADEHFAVMLDDDDRPIDDSYRLERRDRLLETLARVQPDLILTELFPFGRRGLRSEIIPLLEAARARSPKPSIVCSVRDILVAPSKPERGPEMVATIRQYYDKVLIHGDPDLVPFEQTFPLAGEIADWLAYTGYIVDPPPTGAAESGLGQNEVIVSAGGGALSEPLLTAAISARGKTRLKEATWRLLAGPSLSQDGFERLRRLAPDGVIVERARPDFTALLANCVLSISQGGYNTIMDVLAAKVRAVIAPYAGGKETEQTLRAGLLQERGALQVVWEDELSPDRLASAVEAALDGPRTDAVGIQTDGAAVSAKLLAQLVAARLLAAS